MFASDLSLVQRSPTECGGPDNDNEAFDLQFLVNVCSVSVLLTSSAYSS